MEEEQFETIIVKPVMCEEELQSVNSPSVMELGKRLLVAAKDGNTEAVRALMKGGAPFATDWLGTTSLHAAAANGHLETCRLLLRSGILKDARTKVEKTPLHMACQEGHSQVALLLLENGADVNACDMLNMTPLHWAVEKEKIETIRVLLHNGADSNIINKFDKSCFDIASDNARQDILDLLQNEPRKGEFTVVEKMRQETRTVTTPRKIMHGSPKHAIEIVNVAASKNVDRPKTAIVLPTYQNKKITAIPKKSVKKVVNEEQRSRLAALQLLEEHGIEMLEGEDINLVASAVGNGQTVVLTEAGKQALSLTDEKGGPRLKTIKKARLDEIPSTAPKFIRIATNNQIMEATTAKAITPKTYVRIDKSPRKIPIITSATLEDINKKFEEAKREAEQYKELYARKQREAEEYRSKLETIAKKSKMIKVETEEMEEEEELDEEDEEEDDEDEGE